MLKWSVLMFPSGVQIQTAEREGEEPQDQVDAR